MNRKIQVAPNARDLATRFTCAGLRTGHAERTLSERADTALRAREASKLVLACLLCFAREASYLCAGRMRLVIPEIWNLEPFKQNNCARDVHLTLYTAARRSS